jgi:hypothetical protein
MEALMRRGMTDFDNLVENGKAAACKTLLKALALRNAFKAGSTALGSLPLHAVIKASTACFSLSDSSLINCSTRLISFFCEYMAAIYRDGSDDGGPNGDVIIRPTTELPLREFGQLLRVHTGWSMRIAFVPEEFAIEKLFRGCPRKITQC